MDDLAQRVTTALKIDDKKAKDSAKQLADCGLVGGWLMMFPSFFKMVADLQREGRNFAVFFRSFGNDLAKIGTEWNAFCENRHPICSRFLEGVGAMDGTVPGIPDRRLKTSNLHTLYRDAQGPCLALGTLTNGPFEGAWDQWSRTKNITEDTRNGRAFLEELGCRTIEGYEPFRWWVRNE